MLLKQAIIFVAQREVLRLLALLAAALRHEHDVHLHGVRLIVLVGLGWIYRCLLLRILDKIRGDEVRRPHVIFSM